MSEALKEVIQAKYGEAAERARSGGEGGCCGSSCGCSDPITSGLYNADETAQLPEEAVAASLGCGNPTALIDLQEGETVLDRAPAAASTSCSPHGASVPRARSTGWT